MENKNLPEIKELIDSIKEELRTELGSIRDELRNSLKTELEGVKAELKAEFEGARARKAPAPPPPPHSPAPGDFPELPTFDKEDERKTEGFDFSDFNGIEIGGSFEAEIVRSDSYSVSVSAEEGLFRNLDVSKENGMLKVRHSKHIGWRARLARPRVRITLPVLKELRISGAAKAVISGFASSEDFKLVLSGASSLSGDIEAGNADFVLSGASRARLTGSAKDVVIKASGANRMDLGDFPVHNAAIRLSGASYVTANMSGRLDARLSGVSHFGWTGDPVMGDIRTTGASTLSRM